MYECYFSKDEIVRLRVSNAMKRICKERPDLFVPYLDGFIDDIAQINQASTQWTLAQLFLWLEDTMTQQQRQKAVKVMQRNLDGSDDWIVQNTTIETLSVWAKNDDTLKAWLLPRLRRFAKSDKKSVAGRANKMLLMLTVK